MRDQAAPDAHWAAIEDRVRNRIARHGFMAHVGAEVELLTPGACTTSVTRRPELLQHMGYFHGGCIAFLVDNATAIAAAINKAASVASRRWICGVAGSTNSTSSTTN